MSEYKVWATNRTCLFNQRKRKTEQNIKLILFPQRKQSVDSEQKPGSGRYLKAGWNLNPSSLMKTHLVQDTAVSPTLLQQHILVGGLFHWFLKPTTWWFLVPLHVSTSTLRDSSSCLFGDVEDHHSDPAGVEIGGNWPEDLGSESPTCFQPNPGSSERKENQRLHPGYGKSGCHSVEVPQACRDLWNCQF